MATQQFSLFKRNCLKMDLKQFLKITPVICWPKVLAKMNRSKLLKMLLMLLL